MKIVIIAREEPVFMGPFLIKLMQAWHKDIKLLAIGKLREAGPKTRSLFSFFERIYAYFLMFEPRGLSLIVLTRLKWFFLRVFGPIGKHFDNLSLDRAAEKLNIPVFKIENPNNKRFLDKLREIQPDIIINQSDYILKSDLLKIPRLGVVNRHGSLLPHNRGRVGSFFSHMEGPGNYGVTIHFVDEGIDSGPIILQKQVQIDPRCCYFRVLKSIFDASFNILNEAIGYLEKGNVKLMPNNVALGSIHNFPTIAELKKYRQIIKERRKE